jgi:hypothetical protein
MKLGAASAINIINIPDSVATYPRVIMDKEKRGIVSRLPCAGLLNL